MKAIKTLTTIFFGLRHLKTLNRKLGTNLITADIKVLYFIHFNGPQTVLNLTAFSPHYRLTGNILPKLIGFGFIEKKEPAVEVDSRQRGARYAITFEGERWLDKYADMLSKARMDLIRLGPNNRL